MAFDPRLVKITFIDEGSTTVFEGDFAITVKGKKTANYVQNSADVTIANISKELRDSLAFKYKPENNMGGVQDRGFVFIDVGRESTGYFRLFEGNISMITVSDPPDITMGILVIADYSKKSDIKSKNFGLTAKASDIAKSIADDMGVDLKFLLKEDISIPNQYYTGDIPGQLRILDIIPFIDVFIDNGTLYLVDSGSSVDNTFHLIAVDNEMIGIPTFTDVGLNVTFLVRPGIGIGSTVRVESNIYPATNGDYVIVNLDFNIASRDTPFYYTAFCTRKIQ